MTGFTTNPQTSFEQQAFSAKANIHFSDTMLLELIGSYAKFDGAFSTDSDQSPFSVQLVDGIQDVDAKTLEARFSSSAGDKFDWTVGAFWYKGEFTNSQQVSIPAFVPTALLVNGQNTTSFGESLGFRARRVCHFSDKLSLTAGAALLHRQEGRGFRQLHRRHATRHRREPLRLEGGHRLQVHRRHDGATPRRPPAIARRRSTRGRSRPRSSSRWMAKKRPRTKSASRATSPTTACA